MHWMIKCRSKPGTGDLRKATIPAHRAHLEKYRAETWFSGPIFTDDGETAIGSLRFIEFPDRATATAYIDADPYAMAGIFESIDIQRWRPSLEHRQLTYERQEGTQQFIVQCTDAPDSAELRAPLRPAHKGYLDGLGRSVIARGPLQTDDGEATTGSAFLLDVAGRAAAETLLAEEPYTKAGGIYGHVTMERWFFGHV
jgi:uncharacterized protein